MSGRRTRLGVLVSGAGTNLEALLRASDADGFPAEVVLVLSNRSTARALEVARDANIPAQAVPQSAFGNDPAARDRAAIKLLRDAQVELVICAGYDRILSDEFLSAFPDAILNVHPSLLPAFAGGMHAVEDALAYGVKVTGCTIQLLDHGQADGGPIILQAAVPVEPDDDAESLRERIHEQEWQLLPRAVELWCTDRLRREGRIVREAGPATSGSPPAGSSGIARPGSAPPMSPASTAMSPVTTKL